MVDKKLILELVDVTGFTWSNGWWWRYYGKMIYGVTIVEGDLELTVKYPRYSAIKKLDGGLSRVRDRNSWVYEISLGDPDLSSKAPAMHNKIMGVLDEDITDLHTGHGSGF